MTTKNIDNQPVEILVVGPMSSGKTLLVKSIVHYYTKKQMWAFNDVQSHMATIGVDISSLTFPAKNRSNINVDLKELGGQMAPIWPSYFQDIRGLMFVVDSSNPFSIPEASIELARCLKSPQLKSCYFAIIFNKSDVTIEEEFSGHYFSNAMLLESFTEDKALHKRVEVIRNCSAINGSNLQQVLHWIERIAYMKPEN